MSSTASNTGAKNNLFDLYVKDVISLARTLVVKLDQVARATNNLVIQKGGSAGIDPNDRRTWKYYQNISGVYNSTDTPMYIESLDGHGTVLFSKDTLSTNPGTKAAYIYGSYYYKELVAKYSDQEHLILGIIYPCDINTAVNADDGTILAYPSFLVEADETNFILDLQTWLYNFIDRWVVQAYAITDNLYIATYLAQITSNLIPAIMNIRLSYCKTNQAHSFHIGQYLRSHGFLDFYLSELTREQALTFYRNIKYYVRHSGFTGNFVELVDLLLTKRDLPAYEYVFTQNAGAINYTSPTDFTNLYPTSKFQRNPLNTPAQSLPLSDYTLNDVLTVIAKAAPGNVAWREGHEDELVNQLRIADSGELKTKIVEVGLPAKLLNAARTPGFIYLQEWIALAATGVYQCRFEITPPNTDVPVQLTQQQALALWAYATNMALRPDDDSAIYDELLRVPLFVADEVAPRVAPNRADLRQKLTKEAVPDDLLDEMLSYVVLAPTTVTSIDDFKTFCTNVYSADLDQFHLYAAQNESSPRGQLAYVVNYCHESFITPVDGLSITTSPYQGVLYTDLFNSMGFNPSSFTGQEFYDLSVLLFQSATGYDLDSVDNPLTVQAAMISLLKQLSSYSILIVANTELSNVLRVSPQEVRINHHAEGEADLTYIETAPVNVTPMSVSTGDEVFLDFNVLFPITPPIFGEAELYDLDIATPSARDPVFVPKTLGFVEVGIYATTTEDPQESFNELTDSQKLALVA